MLKRICAGLLLLAASLPGVSLQARAEEPLDPDQAFRFSARMLDAQTVEARWQIAPGYYMYREKFRFAAEPDSTLLGKPEIPPGKVKEDETFGRVETYRDEVRVRIPLSGNGRMLTLLSTYQGCADLGICYPPQQKRTILAVPSLSTPPLVNEPGQMPQAGPVPDALPDNGPVAEQDQLADLLAQGSLWLIVVSFLGLGLLLAFTPCVLPMMPILSGIIVGQGHAIGRGRAFVLSSVYVLAMALTYALAGVAAGLSGTLLSSALQNAWVLGGFALVFVILALAMFGFYELQMPAALQSRFAGSANRQGGSLLGVGAMGALSALIVGPCVAAPLAGALLYIARTGDAVLGGLALFALALGMGLPLIVVGTFSRALLPRTGPWMEAIKKAFGVILLGVALWLVMPVIPDWLAMLGWGLLLVVPAIYLRALESLPARATGWHYLWKGVGIALLLSGAAILVGLMAGSRDPLRPLAFLQDDNGPRAVAPAFASVHSVVELDEFLASAGRPVLLDFYADWCVSCKEMEKYTFSDPAVAARLGNFVLLRADVTADSPDDKALLQRFGLFGPPGIIFFDSDGRERKNLRVVGYKKAPDFLNVLQAAAP